MPGPTGPTGPTGGGGTITTRTSGITVPNPTVNVPIPVMADCAADELVLGGGVRVDVADPRDVGRFHMQQDGPTDTGWLGQVAATAAFHASLTVTVTVYCGT